MERNGNTGESGPDRGLFDRPEGEPEARPGIAFLRAAGLSERQEQALAAWWDAGRGDAPPGSEAAEPFAELAERCGAWWRERLAQEPAALERPQRALLRFLQRARDGSERAAPRSGSGAAGSRAGADHPEARAGDRSLPWDAFHRELAAATEAVLAERQRSGQVPPPAELGLGTAFRDAHRAAEAEALRTLAIDTAPPDGDVGIARCAQSELASRQRRTVAAREARDAHARQARRLGRWEARQAAASAALGLPVPAPGDLAALGLRVARQGQERLAPAPSPEPDGPEPAPPEGPEPAPDPEDDAW